MDPETDPQGMVTEILDTTDHAKTTPENVNTKATVMRILGILASLGDTRWLVTGLSDGGFSSVFLPFTTGVSGCDTTFPPKGSMPSFNLPPDAFRMPNTPISSW